MPKNNTLRKAEKLRHKNLVNALFKEGKSLYEFPLRLVWRSLTEEELAESFCKGIPDGLDPLQMMITVPKKKRKRAVDRVLLRRRIREAYRLHRHPLKEAVEADPTIATLSLSFIFLGEENTPYADIETRMRRLLERLQKKIPRSG